MAADVSDEGAKLGPKSPGGAKRRPAPPPPPDPPPESRSSSQSAADNKAFGRFADMPIDVGVQLDRKKVKVSEVLNLQVDYVVEMERSAGENVDLLLDGLIVGNGEIVVIEDMMGLRVTDLALPDDEQEGSG